MRKAIHAFVRLSVLVPLLLQLRDVSAQSCQWEGVSGGGGDIESLILYQGDLYAAGLFTQAGNTSANHIARWDGFNWLSLGMGRDNVVYATTIFNGELITGGLFTNAGGLPANNVARWNGSVWGPLGAGMNFGGVNDLLVYNGELYAAGNFTMAGGVMANRIAKWNGTTWTALLGPAAPPNNNGLNSSASVLALYNDGNGTDLYIGGNFVTAGGIGTWRIARWDGTGFSNLGSGGVLGMDGNVLALAVFNGQLYAGGSFTSAAGVPAHNIARWNGSSWSAVGNGIGLNGRVDHLTVFNDGSGAALYAGGAFTSADGVPTSSHLARWNGTNWSAVGGGMNGPVLTSAAVTGVAGLDSGLYVGGSFTVAGGTFSPPGIDASCLARWDGQAWAAVGQCTDDCNDNGVPDAQDIEDGVSEDCNQNLVPDECDIVNGFSEDCNDNGIPDDCENFTDCNFNSIPDECETDCNGNGIPDDCESFPDCNDNFVPDACDIEDGVSADDNGNGVPDECEDDCNGNGTADDQDIANGTSQDCNQNQIPDECDLVNGTEDCNGNGVPDECDITIGGGSTDLNQNGIPDECEPDCNDNGLPDFLDIQLLISQDANQNGIPDECEQCAGDVNGDGVVNVTDLVEVIVAWGACTAPCPADLNGDGQVNVTDLVELIVNWGTCG